MQSYLYDKSLNIYFGYKGRNSHVPSLCPSTLKISILGNQFILDDPTLPISNLSQSDVVISTSDFSLSEPRLSRTHKSNNSEYKSESESKKEKEKTAHKRKKSGFWQSLWKRKSNSNLESRRRKWDKERLEKNLIIDNKVFDIAWFSYRKGFRASFYEKTRSDSGWGCMIRSGQMLLFTVINRLVKKPLFSIMGVYFDKLIFRGVFS